MIKKNYAAAMDDELEALKAKGLRPKLLLHLCCAPCSSYVIGLLESHFELLLYFYDPNIHPLQEYEKRRDEAKRQASEKNIDFVEGPYDVERWHDIANGRADDPEKGERCRLCYDMRLSEAARFASETGCDYFTTVLSISPHKDARKINETGFRLASESGVRFLPADFKKREGFKKSLELSREYGFYRQDYCGCIYSRRNVEGQKTELTAKAQRAQS